MFWALTLVCCRSLRDLVQPRPPLSSGSRPRPLSGACRLGLFRACWTLTTSAHGRNLLWRPWSTPSREFKFIYWRLTVVMAGCHIKWCIFFCLFEETSLLSSSCSCLCLCFLHIAWQSKTRWLPFIHFSCLLLALALCTSMPCGQVNIYGTWQKHVCCCWIFCHSQKTTIILLQKLASANS